MPPHWLGTWGIPSQNHYLAGGPEPHPQPGNTRKPGETMASCLSATMSKRFRGERRQLLIRCQGELGGR
jgi:hypothetical protein